MLSRDAICGSILRQRLHRRTPNVVCILCNRRHTRFSDRGDAHTNGPEATITPEAETRHYGYVLARGNVSPPWHTVHADH